MGFVNNKVDYYQSEYGDCFGLIEAVIGKKGLMSFCIGNYIKYNFRAGNKKGNSADQDKAKATAYMIKIMQLRNEGVKI